MTTEAVWVGAELQVNTIVTEPPVGAPVSDNFRQFNTAPDKSILGSSNDVFEKVD